MSNENEIIKLREGCQHLLKIVGENEAEIESLRSRLQQRPTEETAFDEYIGIFKKFVKQAKQQNWIIESKYNTKSSRDFINVDFTKYIEFIKSNLQEQRHADFKKFMESLQLIDAQSTNFMMYNKERIRTVKVRAEAYNRLAN